MRRRLNNAVVLDTIAMHATIVQVLSGKDHLKKFIKEMRDGD